MNDLTYLDKVPADSSYLAGDTFSVAGITAFAGLGFAAFAEIELPDDLDHLKDWHRRVAARPSIAS
ncbi:MAG: glutathione binding-like protein [Pseudomonadota bacterium]